MTDSALVSVNGAQPVPSLPLNDEERQHLLVYESHIEHGLAALYNIKQEGLWREYGSFGRYVQQRWNMNPRRVNQQVAGYGVILLLEERFEGTDTPVAQTEYAVRPLVTLAQENPALAAVVYQTAVELAGGQAPTHDLMMLARTLTLTPQELDRERVIRQLEALRHYAYLVEEIAQGGAPARALALATALESCEDYVAERLRQADVRDLSLIRLINEGYRLNRETALDTLQTGYLQSGEWSVPLKEATAKDYRRLLDESWHEHLAQQRDERIVGQPVSIVIFPDDLQGTCESLIEVLGYVRFIRLGALIGEL